MKFLITGADGQVGKELTSLLSKTSHQVVALNKQALDITNTQQIRLQIAAHSPDWVINAAAYTAVDQAEQETEKCFSVNAQAVETLAQITAQHKIPLLHLSTDYVFSGEKSSPYVENDEALPKTIYGKSKLAGELFIQKNNPQHIILRTSWIFGNYGDSFFQKIYQLLNTEKQIKVVNDQVGSPTWSRDLAEAIIHICTHSKNNQWGVYHYSGEPYISWYQFAQHIAATMPDDSLQEKLLAIKSEESTNKTPRPKNSCLNTQKIFQTFGVKPADWKTAIAQIINDRLARA